MVYMIEGDNGELFATEAVSDAHACSIAELLVGDAFVEPRPDLDLLVLMEHGEASRTA